MNLPADALAALKASLQNEDHAWAVVAQMEHHHVSYRGDDDLVVVTMRTYQLQSAPLGLLIPITIELEDDSLEVIQLFFQGTGFNTTDAELRNMLESMAGPAGEAAAAALLAKLTA